VRRRDKSNGAAAKSRCSRVVPAEWMLVQAYDQYVIERNARAAARRCDFVLINLFRGQIGEPMRPGALNECWWNCPVGLG
jgi:integrase/recombinase XerD